MPGERCASGFPHWTGPSGEGCSEFCHGQLLTETRTLGLSLSSFSVVWSPDGVLQTTHGGSGYRQLDSILRGCLSAWESHQEGPKSWTWQRSQDPDMGGGGSMPHLSPGPCSIPESSAPSLGSKGMTFLERFNELYLQETIPLTCSW